MYPIIDGDILVYRCGFAAEHTEYILTDYRDNEKHRFRYKKEANAYLAANQEDSYFLQTETIVEPMEFALQNVKVTLEKIMELAKAEPNKYEIWLSGPTNYRDQLATTRVYKGNRDPEHKPTWYQEIKDYLVNYHNAKFSEGCEADDMLAIRANEIRKTVTQEDTIVIVSTDKDLDQVPGVHINWVKEEIYYISKEEASRFYWEQVISGDPSDNIQGIPGMGPVKAKQYLDKYDPAEWEWAVEQLYIDHYLHNPTSVFEEHKMLIKIGLLKEDAQVNHESTTTQEENDVSTGC